MTLDRFQKEEVHLQEKKLLFNSFSMRKYELHAPPHPTALSISFSLPFSISNSAFLFL